MKKTGYLVVVFATLLGMCVFSSSKVEASTINLEGTTYTINTSNEYNSDTQVEWITISSDRSEGSRICVEFDINALKDYNSTDGLIYYSVVKEWLNKLEEAIDYFCELNTYPKDETLVIEWTGVSKQYASAYVTVANNRIIMNKEYHKKSLKRMQHANDQGIIDICGTVLHEMGHKFTGSSKFDTSYSTWDVGVEYINLILVQYVLDNLIQNNDNIVANVYPYYDILCASEGTIEKGYTSLYESYAKLYTNYATCWEKIKTDTSYENQGDASYLDVLVNYTKIMDTIGQDVVRKTFNTYFTESIKNYNTETQYDRFITFTKILKSYTTDEVWNKVSSNYTALYNKYVVNITLNQNSYDIIKGKSKTIDYEYSFNSTEHDDFTPEFSSRNKSIATVNSSGVITAQNEGTTQIRVKVGNQYALVTVNVLPEDTEIKLEFSKSSYVITDLDDTLTFNSVITPNGLSDYLEWSSSDTSVAKVNSSGVVTPISNGTCKITVRTVDGSDLSASVNIIVNIPIKVTGITFDTTTEYTITNINQTPSFRPTISPSNATNKNVKWTSSDESVATVNSSGVVTPISNGTCKITATTVDGSNLSASINIIVDISIKVTGISFNSTNEYTITNINQTPSFNPTITPSNATNKNVKWTSSNKSIATVNSLGAVKPVGNGKCKITATTVDGSNLSASIDIIVDIPSLGYKKGDINKDGVINVNDVIYGGKGFTNGTLTDEEKEIGNVNGDSVFNINDLIKIMKYVVGKISSLD